MYSITDYLAHQLEDEVFSSLPKKTPTLKSDRRFVKGPIDAEWLEAAARLPGKTLHVAMACMYLRGFGNTDRVTLKPSVRDLYGVDRFAANRALKLLEAHGLATVKRNPGAAPIIQIIPISLAPNL